jgi:hypothetical protein
MDMKAHTIVALLLGVSLTGCHIGGNASEYFEARNVRGAIVQIYTPSGRTEGELLSVRDDGVIAFLRDGRVALVPWRSTTLVAAKGFGQSYQYGSRVPPRPDVKKNLALVSHFPQGMTPEIQSRVLASRGQAQLVMLQ